MAKGDATGGGTDMGGGVKGQNKIDQYHVMNRLLDTPTADQSKQGIAPSGGQSFDMSQIAAPAGKMLGGRFGGMQGSVMGNPSIGYNTGINGGQTGGAMGGSFLSGDDQMNQNAGLMQQMAQMAARFQPGGSLFGGASVAPSNPQDMLRRTMTSQYGGGDNSRFQY